MPKELLENHIEYHANINKFNIQSFSFHFFTYSLFFLCFVLYWKYYFPSYLPLFSIFYYYIFEYFIGDITWKFNSLFEMWFCALCVRSAFETKMRKLPVETLVTFEYLFNSMLFSGFFFLIFRTIILLMYIFFFFSLVCFFLYWFKLYFYQHRIQRM